MIGTALDQVQKLFGRGFWLAAFVPSLLFVGIASYLLMDLDGLRSTVLALTQKDLKEAGLNIVLSVVAVYLMAYVVYGARSAIHDLYRGEWPITLRWLERLCLRQQRRARNRALAELQAREVLLDNVRWATTFGFTITFSEENIATSEAIADLLKARQQHADLVAYARGLHGVDPKLDDSWAERYVAVLKLGRILQANASNFEEPLPNDINAFIDQIKNAYSAQPAFQRAAAEYESTALRQWTLAYTRFVSNYPEDERFLAPTALGNVARVQELYPFKHYGIELSALWPRLVHVWTKDARTRVEEASTFLDFTVITSAISVFAAMLAIVVIFVGPPRALALQLAQVVVFLFAFWLFYRLAIHATRVVGFQMQAAIDLFRFKLLEALGIEAPATPRDEKLLWHEMNEFINRAEAPGQYVRFKRGGKSARKNGGNKK